MSTATAPTPSASNGAIPTTATTVAPPASPPAVPTPNVEVGLGTRDGFEAIQRTAKLLASSTLVPKQYQGNLPNCVIAMEMAARIGASPLMVMQNLYVVHGNPSWSAKFLISAFNSCGRFSAVRFKFTGNRSDDTWGCIASAVEKSTGELLVGPEITIAMAKKEGWVGKAGSKWQSMPEQMLRYRAAAWFINTTAPELTMGLNTVDEVEDFAGPALPAAETKTEQVANLLGAAPAPPAEDLVTTLKRQIFEAKTTEELDTIVAAANTAREADELTQEQRDLIDRQATRKAQELMATAE